MDTFRTFSASVKHRNLTGREIVNRINTSYYIQGKKEFYVVVVVVVVVVFVNLATSP